MRAIEAILNDHDAVLVDSCLQHGDDETSWINYVEQPEMSLVKIDLVDLEKAAQYSGRQRRWWRHPNSFSVPGLSTECNNVCFITQKILGSQRDTKSLKTRSLKRIVRNYEAISSLSRKCEVTIRNQEHLSLYALAVKNSNRSRWAKRNFFDFYELRPWGDEDMFATATLRQQQGDDCAIITRDRKFIRSVQNMYLDYGIPEHERISMYYAPVFGHAKKVHFD